MGNRARLRLDLAAVAVLAAFAPSVAQQGYPSRPIHLVVGFPAGSGADIGVRYVGEKLQEVSRNTVIVENKPGAGSNIAIGIVAKAKPDGYTVLLAASSAMAGSRFLYKDFKIDTAAEFEPAALLYRTNFALAVAPDSTLATVDDLTRHLQSKPRNLHAYTNQTGQIAAAFYLSKVAARSEAVSYRTAAEAVADLGSSTLDFMMLDGSFSSGQYRAGRIKPLAVTAERRSSVMPQVPTMHEAGVQGFEFSPFWAAYVPKSTPPEIIRRLTGWLIEVIKLDATRRQYETTGSIAIGEGPEQARLALQSEIERWALAVKAAGIEPQ